MSGQQVSRKRKLDQALPVESFVAYLHYRLRHRTAAEEAVLVRRLIHEYHFVDGVDGVEIDANSARQRLQRVAHLPASELHAHYKEYMVCELEFESDYDRDFYRFCQLRLQEMSDQQLLKLAETLLSRPEFQEDFEVDNLQAAFEFLRAMAQHFDIDYELQFFDSVFTRQFANWLVNH